MTPALSDAGEPGLGKARVGLQGGLLAEELLSGTHFPRPTPTSRARVRVFSQGRGLVGIFMMCMQKGAGGSGPGRGGGGELGP